MRDLMLATAILINALLPITTPCPASDNLPTQYRGLDFESGCTCREYLRTYATCYDPEECLIFPKRFRTTLPCFRLATTAVSELTIGDLKHYRHLAGLYIDGNAKLVHIQPGVFRHMTNLKNLSISYNQNLMKLEDDVFEGLVNLEYLQISRNAFADIKNFTQALKTAHLPNLRKLYLKEQTCPVVRQSDFINLKDSKLEELIIFDSKIEYIYPDAFTHLKYLRSLNLGQNLFNVSTTIELIDTMTKKGIPLGELSLFSSGYRKRIPENLLLTIANSGIKNLSVAGNQFDELYDDSFPYMPNIELLNLSDCLITNVTAGAFKNFPNLRTLILLKNKFTFVPDGLLIPTLKKLDMSSNTFQVDITSYFTLQEHKFVNMTNLEILDLSANNFRKVSRNSFHGLRNLKELHMEDCQIYYLESQTFVHLEKLEYLNLGSNLFPTRRFHKDIFYGLTNLKHLRLANCKLSCIPTESNIFEYLVSLEHLDLSSNELHEITPDVLQPLQNLKFLNVWNNQITTWHRRMFTRLGKMENLVASQNKLQYFTVAMLKDFSKLKEFDISDNAFNCNCDLVENFQTLTPKNLSHVLQSLGESTQCSAPDKFKYRSIQQFYHSQRKECEIENMRKYLHYIIPSVICLLLAGLIAILSYLYRWHIRYWIFLTKLSLTRRAQFHKRKNVKCHANYLYDAFVSYSNEDRNFVIRLVSMLENYEPFLKLCVYERDFEIGTIISESVLECVSMSRKTLLIISNSYIKSQWCTWEAQVAEHHRLFFENEYGECVNDSIVMVKLGNISSKNISPMLKYLMKTRIYLQWDPADNKQKQFWDKLRNALAPSEDDQRTCTKV